MKNRPPFWLFIKYKYIKNYSAYNYILHLLLIVVCCWFFNPSTVICTDESALVVVPVKEEPNPIYSFYDTYEGFKEYMNLKTINLTPLINDHIEPLTLIYLRATLCGLKFYTMSLNMDDWFFGTIFDAMGNTRQWVTMLTITNSLYENFKLFNTFGLQNLIVHMAQLNVEMKDPFLKLLIDLLMFKDESAIQTKKLFYQETIRAVEHFQQLFNIPLRTETYFNTHLNKFLYFIEDGLENFITPPPFNHLNPADPLIISTVEATALHDGTTYNSLMNTIMEDTLRFIRLNVYALENETLSPNFIKSCIYNLILNHTTDYLFWSQLHNMSHVDFCSFINASISCIDHAILKCENDPISSNTLHILREIFMEVSDFNNDELGLNMKQIVQYLSTYKL